MVLRSTIRQHACSAFELLPEIYFHISNSDWRLQYAWYHRSFHFSHFSWSVIALRCCVSFCRTTARVSYKQTYSPPSRTPHHSAPSARHRALGGAICAIQQLPTSYLLYTWPCVCVNAAFSVRLTLSFPSSRPQCVLYVHVFIPALRRGSPVPFSRFHIYFSQHEQTIFHDQTLCCPHAYFSFSTQSIVEGREPVFLIFWDPLWHWLSLGLEWKLTLSSPVATAEFSKFSCILSAALSQHHLSGFEIAQLEFHHLH